MIGMMANVPNAREFIQTTAPSIKVLKALHVGMYLNDQNYHFLLFRRQIIR
jgi:hypothetical protein